jgi:hypothetical protein
VLVLVLVLVLDSTVRTSTSAAPPLAPCLLQTEAIRVTAR